MALQQILKKVKIDHFTGNSFDENVTDWILQLDEFFDAQDTPEDERLRSAPVMFSSTAKSWWRNFQIQFMENHGTWLDFKQALVGQFEDPNMVQNARDDLGHLRQTHSVIRYTEQFNRLRARAGNVSEAEAIQRFRDGLKSSIQYHFRGNPDHTQSLAQVQRIAGSLDNTWHRSRSTSQFQPSGRYETTQGRFPQPMELDSAYVQHRNSGPSRPRADPAKEEDYRKGNCFYCHQHGHVAVNCPRKPQAGNARS